MSGLLAGIMLARPLASFMTGLFGWRSVYFLSAGSMALIGFALALTLPRRLPAGEKSDGAILASMVLLAKKHRQLQLRAFYQAAMYTTFNFWTAAPLILLRRFHFTQNDVALFALASAGRSHRGIAGRPGNDCLTTWIAHALLIICFLAADSVVAAGSVIAFVVTALLIDAAVQLYQITSQKIIFDISEEARGRIIRFI